jgi:hypothetical protein
MSNAIQRLFQTHGNAYIQTYQLHMLSSHCKVIRAIQRCGSASCGVHLYACDACEQLHEINSSCGNRHCPACQGGKSDEWLQKQMERVLPVNYFMITFTVPESLRRTFRSNQKACYKAMFKAASGALKKLAKDGRHIGCELPGFTGVLHTWTRQLEYHPHVHFIVPGGGLSQDRAEWKGAKNRFYLPARPLSRLYRGKLIDELGSAGVELPDGLYATDWVVDVRNVGNGTAALNYLAQYVFRIAIAPGRISEVTKTHVTFRYQPSGKKVWRKCTLTIFEFMRRYLQHVLPHGFTKVRHYGFMSPGSKMPLEKIRALICLLYEIIAPVIPEKTGKKKEPIACLHCEAGILRWLEFVPCPRGVG